LQLWSRSKELAVEIVEAAVVAEVVELLLRLLCVLRLETGLDQRRSEGGSGFVGLSNLEQLVLENIELLLLGQAKSFSLLFCLLLVDKASLGDLVLGAGLVLVVEAVSESGRDLFPSDGFTASCVSVLVVSDKGWRVSFLEAGFFNEEVNVGDNGRLDHLGSGVDVFVDLGLDESSQLAISRSLLGDASLSNDYCAFGRNNSRRGCSRGNGRRLELLSVEHFVLSEERSGASEGRVGSLCVTHCWNVNL